ncbi:hypothetical protein SCHPADRAFT_896155, partial [Schizopora paradoxa]
CLRDLGPGQGAAEKRRLKLLYLEDEYGLAMRKHFPPEVGSNIDLEEKAKGGDYNSSAFYLSFPARFFRRSLGFAPRSSAIVTHNNIQTNVSGLLLTVHFISRFWNKKGFGGLELVTLASALLTLWELKYCCSRIRDEDTTWTPIYVSFHFMDGIMGTLRKIGDCVFDKRSEYDAAITAGTIVFKLHYFLCNMNHERWYDGLHILKKPWNTVCHAYLPNLEHAKLCRKLQLLDGLHGPAMRERYPPRDSNWNGREEEAR